MQDRRYFFILGRNPALSIAEIGAVLERERQSYKISGYSEEVLIVDTGKFDVVRFAELGGSIKFGEILGDYNNDINLRSFFPKTVNKDLISEANIKISSSL